MYHVTNSSQHAKHIQKTDNGSLVVAMKITIQCRIHDVQSVKYAL